MLNLFTHGIITGGGSVNNGVTDVPIHVASLYQNEEDIAEQILFSDPAGHMIRLKDVARVVKEYPEPDSYILNNAKKCVLISMEMQQGNNIVDYGKEVDKVLHDFQRELPPDVSMKRIADQPRVVGDSISTFLARADICHHFCNPGHHDTAAFPGSLGGCNIHTAHHIYFPWPDDAFRH